MKIKHLLSVFAGCALIALASLTAAAQTGRLEGDVVKADTKEPIIGAEVQIERTDIKGSYPVKTDKKGHYLHAGVPYVGTYIIMVSAPGCQPDFAEVKGSQTDPIKFELRPGDGRKLTVAEVKGAAGKAKPGPGGAAPPKMSEEEVKKAKEEYEKAKKENEEAEKFNSAIEQINVHLKAGNDAMSKNDVNAAITSFKEAVNLNPNIHISQGNLGIALQKRAVAQFNSGNRDAAKQDFLDSIEAMNKALAGLDAQEKDTKMKNDPAQNKNNRRAYYMTRTESESILGGKFGDSAQADAAVKDYQVVAELTDDPAKKKEYTLKSAKVLFESGKVDESIAAYQKILETDPDNIDVLYELGLAYANVAKFQDSANTLQKFLDKAPESNPHVVEVKSVIAELVKGNNITPPKSEPARGSRGPAKKKP
jgi:tetratricopeptide (TPR) repeat protein